MKHVFVALAAVGLLVSGCGAAESPEGVGTESDSVEQQLTPCLSECFGYCSRNNSTPEGLLECRADCRVQCESGEY